jgi:hypothetical protein
MAIRRHAYGRRDAPADCEAELDDLLSCMSDERDACDAIIDGPCVDENNDFTDCLGDYCTDNPTSDACEDLVLS